MAIKSKDTSVVKIDSMLLKDVERFIAQSENKFKFVNKKQFIDLAVYAYLSEQKNGGNNAKKK